MRSDTPPAQRHPGKPSWKVVTRGFEPGPLFPAGGPGQFEGHVRVSGAGWVGRGQSQGLGREMEQSSRSQPWPTAITAPGWRTPEPR